MKLLIFNVYIRKGNKYMKKKFLALLLTLCMMISLLVTVTPAEEKLPFSDVKETDWFYSAVKYVYDIGIMKGTNTAGTIFEPDTTVSRAMFVAMLGRLHGAEEKLTSKYPDVNADKLDWYNGYVGWASENGIITGYSNGNFAPNDPVTREQMATIISRYITYTGVLAKLSIDAPASFPDIDSVSSYAVKPVETMRMMGIIKGNAAGEFDPKSGLNRASAATIIMRLDEMLSELELGDAINPDYTVEGEDFVLMGAYDLYYGGTALDTGYSGLGVMSENGYPYVTYDENDMQFFISKSSRTGANGTVFPVSPEINPLTDADYYFEFDMKIACIDPAEYPFVRIAYRTAGDASIGLFDSKKGTSDISFTPTSEKVSGFSYGIIDLSGKFDLGSECIIPTVTSSSDIDILYFAAFPTKKAAEDFDITKYKTHIESYDGEIVPVKNANESDVKAAIAEANTKAQDIINSTNDIDPATITGKCYYISSINGDDSNSGTSPEEAWASFRNLYNVQAGGAIIISTVKPGDGVFLERGSNFNTQVGEMNYIDIARGVAYSAYGEGPKPIITAELPMNEPAGKWSDTEWKNVWKLDYEVFDNPGNISFVKKDGTTLWGIMVIPSNLHNPFNSKKSRNYGYVSNGEETFLSGNVPLENPGSLKNNLEYIGDAEKGELYLYCRDGNPGEVFAEIHISMSDGMVGFNEKSTHSTIPARFDNIAFKYTGTCAMAFGTASNLYITNCTFEWIGGAYQGDDGTRYGNAIQNWGPCDGIFIKDCYFKDIYDAAVTTQGMFGVMRNFYASGCVLDRCDLSFEFFNHGQQEGSELSNLFLTDNYVINNGYGFCDVRTDRRSAFLYTSYGTNTTKYENIVYENNVNVYSAEYAIFSGVIALGNTEGTILKNNVYYMDPVESYFGKFMYNMIDRTGDQSTFYPFTSRYLTYLNSIGVETGSTFYSTTNPDINCAD